MRLLLTLLFLPATLFAAEDKTAETDPFSKWEPAIQKFEAADRTAPPKKDGILFAGSSSIVFWDLKQSFPELDALNRGFGGSTVADVLHFFDRVITPYAPATIVFYSGDNDIASGKEPAAVSADYRAFVEKVHATLPKTRILLLGIKPSNQRWTLWEKMQEVNGSLKTLAEQDALVQFVDTAPPLLGADGKPRPELFKEDGLHLNEAGYAVWTPLVASALQHPE